MYAHIKLTSFVLVSQALFPAIDRPDVHEDGSRNQLCSIPERVVQATNT